MIAPYVEDYYNCLKSGGHKIDGNTFFEEQHRIDIPRCDDRKAELINQSQGALGRTEQLGTFGRDKVESVFDTIGYIHIARARDLDSHLGMSVVTRQMYDRIEAEQAKPVEEPEPMG